jgi:hypothetical protein
MVTNTRAWIVLLALGLSAWSNAAALAGTDRGDLGTPTRPASAEPAGAIDVFRSRHHCLGTVDRVTLQRPDANGPSTAILRHTGSGATAKITWDAGATLTGWPAGFAVEDGDTIQVLVAGSLASTRLTVHIVPRQMAQPARLAVWMARMGCSAQARSLLARV